MSARDDYWNAEEMGPVYVDEWTIKLYKDPATMFMELEAGNIQFCECHQLTTAALSKTAQKATVSVFTSSAAAAPCISPSASMITDLE
jgi:ABC-type transport system substrate-binding protein